MLRASMSLALVLLSAASGSAQALRSFDDLATRINVNDRVSITTSGGVRASGRVVRLAPEAIVIGASGRETQIGAGEVVEIALVRQTRLLGALAGAAVGTLAIGIPECNDDPTDQCGDGLAMGALLGAGVGTIAGAFIPRTTVVYRAPGRIAFVSPVVGRRAVGVVARVRW